MILNYEKFNEQFGDIPDLNDGDRVICHGEVKYYYNGWRRTSIEGQTGIVSNYFLGKSLGIAFDNYFVNYLNNLNGNIKFKRGLFIFPNGKLITENNQLEKVDQIKSGKCTSFSDKCKLVLSYLEYMDCSYYLSDIDYIDITSENDTISYISKNRLGRLGPDDDQWKNNFRQEMKIGKFIQILNPYTNQKSLDKKIDLFKSAHDGITGKFKFYIVKDKEIIEWYNEDRYQEGTGSLNQSCMRSHLERLYLYQDCEKVSLLIMVNDTNKLVGRALIWNVDDPKITYIDRPYTVYQSDIHRFEEYAMDKGWNYWERDKDKPMVIYMGQELGSAEDNPYMDTFDIFYRHGQKGKYYLTNYLEPDQETEDFEMFNEP